MAFDALGEHASAAERKVVLQRHRMVLLLMGVVCGYLGAAPAVIWASGVIFAAAFFILIPVGIWSAVPGAAQSTAPAPALEHG